MVCNEHSLTTLYAQFSYNFYPSLPTIVLCSLNYLSSVLLGCILSTTYSIVVFYLLLIQRLYSVYYLFSSCILLLSNMMYFQLTQHNFSVLTESLIKKAGDPPSCQKMVLLAGSEQVGLLWDPQLGIVV
jgi:hypothetical protein